jgi:hypothetical protein
MLIEGQTEHYLHCIIFKEGLRLVRQKERDKSFHVTLNTVGTVPWQANSIEIVSLFPFTSRGIEVEYHVI